MNKKVVIGLYLLCGIILTICKTPLGPGIILVTLSLALANRSYK